MARPPTNHVCRCSTCGRRMRYPTVKTVSEAHQHYVATGYKAGDKYACPVCGEWYQLKSSGVFRRHGSTGYLGKEPCLGTGRRPNPS